MKATGAEIVREARSMVGTPFHHQGRLPGCGLDCVGLAVAIADRLGIEVRDQTDYPPETDGDALLAALEHACDPVPVGRARVGDLLQFRRGRGLWHVAIVSRLAEPLEVIHARAHDGGGEVTEEPLTPEWTRRLVGVWRLRGAA